MSRAIGSLLLVGMATGVVSAQPGASQPYAPPPPPAPAGQPYAPNQPYAPPAYNYQPPMVQLTAEEAEILQNGPISDGAHIGGGFAALFLGFGIGQAVQGRWSDKGWIFTVGDLGSLTMMIYGMTNMLTACAVDDDPYTDSCDNDGNGAGFLVIGALAYTGFRIWETVDAFAAPGAYNARYRDLQFRVRGYAAPPQWGLYMAPSMDRQARVTGLTLRF